MLLHPEQLLKIMPKVNEHRVLEYSWALSKALTAYGINTVMSVAHFLGQVAVESGELNYTTELTDGKAYEGRESLGNTEPGDGSRFKGHGWMQVTGRRRHRQLGEEMGLDLINDPELLYAPEHAATSAAIIWERMVTREDWLSKRAIRNGVTVGGSLSLYAARGDIEKITWAINGGQTHLSSRRDFTKVAIIELSRSAVLE